MKVLERWKFYQDDRFYMDLVSDQELLALAEQLFGDTPGIGQILQAPTPPYRTPWMSGAPCHFRVARLEASHGVARQRPALERS